MSSNIGAEAQAAYNRYLDAGSLDLKIKFLTEFISLVPKHKATEKIVALNKSRLAKLKREVKAEKQRTKTLHKVISPFSIKKEGIQVILISCYFTPGTGKTTVLNYLTGAAKAKIGKYTSLPEIGIYRYHKIRFQIVEMPSIMENASSKGVGNGKEILAQIRSCDLICLCIDLSRNVDEQVNLLLSELTKADIKINRPPPLLNIEKTGSNKIQVFYLTDQAKNIDDLGEFTERIKEIVNANGVRNAIVKVYGEISLDDIIDTLTPSVVYKKAMIIATKGDLSYTEDIFSELKRNYSDKFPLIIGTSIHKGNFPQDFGELILRYLEKIRIYTMSSGGQIAEKPLIMDKHCTVRDAAIKIHKTFYELFDHATVIRESARQKRKKVGLDYILIDKDIIEIFTL